MFYARWMSIYVQKKEFLFAFDILKLFKQNCTEIATSSNWWGDKFVSRKDMERHLKNLQKKFKCDLELETTFAIQEDFMNKVYFIDESNLKKVSYRKIERIRKKYGIYTGIEYEEFMEIKNKTLQKRTSEVLEKIYGFDELYCKRLTESIRTSESIKNSPGYKSGEESDIAEEILTKLKSRRDAMEMSRLSCSLEKKLSIGNVSMKRMKFSDLFNKKVFKEKKMEIFIDKEFRKKFVCENHSALKYEYYKRKYGHLDQNEQIMGKQSFMDSNDLKMSFFGELNWAELLLFDEFSLFSFKDSLSFKTKEDYIFFVKKSNQDQLKQMVHSKVLFLVKKRKNKKRVKKKLVAKKLKPGFRVSIDPEFMIDFTMSPVVTHRPQELSFGKYKRKGSFRSSLLAKEMPRFNS
jgi:phage pi2 protein 07